MHLSALSAPIPLPSPALKSSAKETKTYIDISITPILLPQTIPQKLPRPPSQPLNSFLPHNITIRIPIRQHPLPLTMLTPRRHRKQRFTSKLHEQLIKFCSVKATAARSIDFFHGGVGRETAFVGGDADYGAVGAVEGVDVEASAAGEFCDDERERGEVCVPWSWEFGERGCEAGVEVVGDEADGYEIDEKHDCSRWLINWDAEKRSTE